MNFDAYLLRMHWVTLDEYARLIKASLFAGDGKSNSDHYLEPSIREELEPEAIARIRPYPIGDVLQKKEEILENVFRRSGLSSFDDLVASWQRWHVDSLHPISDYRLGTNGDVSFGRRLYDREIEKRLCAEFVASFLIKTADHVIVPEGSSAFWVGLAAMKHWSNLQLITSNGPLIRELHENPFLRSRCREVHVVGGLMDLEVREGGSASRGFLGEVTKSGFTFVFRRKGATVVVSSVNGLTADRGPFAPCPISGSTRHSLLLNALDKKSNVRKVVFVADHTKMRPSLNDSYGDPIFNDRKQWQEIIETHRDKIAIVVAPIEEVRNNPELLAIPPAERVIHGKHYPKPVEEYLRAAKELDELCRGNGFESCFHEAVQDVNRKVSPVLK